MVILVSVIKLFSILLSTFVGVTFLLTNTTNCICIFLYCVCVLWGWWWGVGVMGLLARAWVLFKSSLIKFYTHRSSKELTGHPSVVFFMGCDISTR